MLSLFIDDSFQSNPSRNGLGSVFALGGVIVQSSVSADLESGIDQFCSDFGFPEGEEFKWSPSRNHWMRSNLTGSRRKHFFRKVLLLANMHGVKAVVVAEDCSSKYERAHCQSSPQEDATDLLIERASLHARNQNCNCNLLIDNPGGNRKTGRQLTKRVSALLEDGTKLNKLRNIDRKILLKDSKSTRLLQLADLVTSCSCAMIAGESLYAPQIFPFILPMLLRHPLHKQVGGVGLKIHPTKHANLYHWLCGDQFLVTRGERIALPTPLRPFYLSPAHLDAGIA